MPDSRLSAEEAARLRETLLEAVREGLGAPRNAANKWAPLYTWFASEFRTEENGRNRSVIGKVIVESKQIGNRVDEMAKWDPKYAIISCMDDVTPDKVLRAMRQRASLPSLRCILFLEEDRPSRIVRFDD
ncbi:hypothetical protein SAMN04515665_1307 [Blastococcus sp. DSM 46786]|uniref:hypothetical protein n=1 Tax=Blastococcus sp. DSM 46786 TaxID=1798227 RepID=UPI0008CB2B83|nr:hypothetical protein [Blastococcus sp. DSM 46786]SEM09036.1 hypothetical protein SAMN04515665_1307 [Blastococcus sp. DSM 46786]